MCDVLSKCKAELGLMCETVMLCGITGVCAQRVKIHHVTPWGATQGGQKFPGN